ncbi:MAG: hypothetical protein LBV42_05260 [Methanobrevibacter sp.]|jgi:hypothetical protein|nr:hypothetical protein [Methanobrevibacter sp.]
MVNKKLLSIVLIVFVICAIVGAYLYANPAPAKVDILDYSYAHHHGSTTGLPYYDIDLEIKNNRLADNIDVDILFKNGDTVIDDNKRHGFPPIGKGQYGYNFIIYNNIIPTETNNIELVFFENSKVITTLSIPDFKKIPDGDHESEESSLDKT